MSGELNSGPRTPSISTASFLPGSGAVGVLGLGLRRGGLLVPAYDSSEPWTGTSHVGRSGAVSQRREEPRMRWGWLGAFLGLVPASAFAMCTCECVDGAVQVLCDDSQGTAPRCPSRACPPAPPSTPPPPMGSPAGASACRPVQMLSPLTETYEWRQLCE